jgi:hypothetical protein
LKQANRAERKVQKRVQKWTSKTALKNGPKNRRKNLPKIPQKRPTIAQNWPQIDHKSPANRHRGEKKVPKTPELGKKEE